MNGSCISKIEIYLPKKVYTNEEIKKVNPNFDTEKIKNKIGISKRHIAAENETALDMATRVCEKMFQHVDKKEIDFIILCTQSPDYKLPTSACILQHRLNLRTDVGAFDYNLGCSGYVYGLALAKSLINTKMASKILLVTSNTYSKYIKGNDFPNRSIFGDAATATLIESSRIEKIGNFDFGTDGSGANNLIVKNGGARFSFYEQNDNDFLYMDGPEIFNFTIANTPKTVENVLIKNDIKLDEIDFVIFHQANKFMLNYLRKKIKIERDKFYINLDKTGNTVSSTIPLALKDSLDNNKIKSGEKVLLTGFGVGYSWCSVIIEV